MGTWSTGPFDGDSSEDFADELERMTPSERRAELEKVLQEAVEAGAETELPDIVIAAVAVIAANLPGGDEVTAEWAEDYPDMPQWLPEPAGLPQLALRALGTALPAESWYWLSWVDADERAEAEENPLGDVRSPDLAYAAYVLKTSDLSGLSQRSA